MGIKIEISFEPYVELIVLFIEKKLMGMGMFHRLLYKYIHMVQPITAHKPGLNRNKIVAAI